jgi:biotin operon repressor
MTIPHRLAGLFQWLTDHQGQLLTAEHLAETLGCSRPTIFRAIHRLEALGVLEVKREQRGLTVRTLEPAIGSATASISRDLARLAGEAAAAPARPRIQGRFPPTAIHPDYNQHLELLHRVPVLAGWTEADLDEVGRLLPRTIELDLTALFHALETFADYLDRCAETARNGSRAARPPQGIYWLQDPKTDWHRKLVGHLAYGPRHAKPIRAASPAPRANPDHILPNPAAAITAPIRELLADLPPATAEKILHRLTTQAQAELKQLGVTDPSQITRRVATLAKQEPRPCPDSTSTN